MTKPKIAFVIGSLRSGGAERVITTLANALISEMDVCIVTFKDVVPFYELHPEVKVISYARDYPKPKHLLQSISLNLKLLRFLTHTFRSENIQLAIGFITMSNILTTLAAKQAGIPSVISERNNPKFESTATFWKFLRKFVYKKASILVVQTEAVKDVYKPLINIQKIKVIPNPVSETLSQQRIENQERKSIILNVGRLTWQKNQKMLIRAFSNIAPKDWKLVIVGKGKLEATLKSEISKSEVSDMIELKSPSSSIHELYNQASIFAFPSRFEGFPNALLEALHFGIPSISTDCPYGPSELIENEKNGFLIASENQGELEEKLKLLIENAELRNSMANQAKLGTEPFREPLVLKQWKQVFEQLIH